MWHQLPACQSGGEQSSITGAAAGNDISDGKGWGTGRLQTDKVRGTVRACGDHRGTLGEEAVWVGGCVGADTVAMVGQFWGVLVPGGSDLNAVCPRTSVSDSPSCSSHQVCSLTRTETQSASWTRVTSPCWRIMGRVEVLMRDVSQDRTGGALRDRGWFSVCHDGFSHSHPHLIRPFSLKHPPRTFYTMSHNVAVTFTKVLIVLILERLCFYSG